MRKTEAWWVCDKCNQPVARVKKGQADELMRVHRTTCHKLACFSMQQIEQRKT